MGISDRDYARAGGGIGAPRSGGGLPRLGTLSVTTWLLIINVAVFMVDALVPPAKYVAVSSGLENTTANFDPAYAVIQRPAAPPPGFIPGALYSAPVIDTRTKEFVGTQLYRFMPPLSAWGHFSTGKAFLPGLEVWRFVTFQFLHGDISHLVLNMMGLFFFGPLVEQHLRTRRRFLSFYLACGVAGALAYLVLNLAGLAFKWKAGFLFEDMYMPLVGASAGIFGILMAAAKFAGNGTMLVMMVIPMRISTGAYLMAALAAFNLLRGGQNAGGDAAHVGGAIAGFFFVRNMHLLRDFLDIFGHSSAPRRKDLKGPDAATQKKLDAILEKVHAEGLHSLTPAEQKFLQAQSGERGTMRR